MAHEHDADVRIAPRINKAVRIGYVDLGQHSPSGEVERRRVSGDGSFELSIRELVKMQTRRGANMYERIRSFRNVDVHSQLVYVGERQDRAAALAVSAGALGGSRRNQSRGFVDSYITATGANQRARIGESPGDNSVERSDDLCIVKHGLQGCNCGLSLAILGIGHIDIFL